MAHTANIYRTWREESGSLRQPGKKPKRGKKSDAMDTDVGELGLHVMKTHDANNEAFATMTSG